MYVKPSRADLLVAMPGAAGSYLPAKGGNVPETTYWLRRIRDGDVVQTEAPSAPAAKKPKPKPKPLEDK